MKNPFARKKSSNRKSKTDILKSWHSELNEINKVSLARTVCYFDLSNSNSNINCDPEKPRSYFGFGSYAQYLKKYSQQLESSISDTQRCQKNISRSIAILLFPGNREAKRREWNYQSIGSFSEESLQLMKEVIPYFSSEESLSIIYRLRAIKVLLECQEKQLIALKPKIIEAIERENKKTRLSNSVLACSLTGILLCISYIYTVKVEIPSAAQAEAERRSRFSQTLDGMMSSGRCTEKRNLHIWMCSRHQTIGSPSLSSSPILGYSYRETVYYFGDGENESYTSVKVFDYRADCEGCPPHKSQERIDLRER